MKNETERAETRHQMVVQGNEFIRHAQAPLTRQEHDIAFFLFSKVRPKDKDFMTINFTIQEICGAFGIASKGGNYDDIKYSLQSLANKSAWAEYRDEKGHRIETLVRWIDTYKINHNNGQMKAVISQSMKPYLLGLIEQGNYTQIMLTTFRALQSRYSKRLYEILKSYAFNQKSHEFHIEKLKKLLNAETYKRFANFKQRVLEVATKEINAATDLNISYETRKSWGTTDYVTFHFEHKDLGRDEGAPENQLSDVAAASHQQPQGKSGDELFEDLWQKVLRKEGKPKARKAFKEALKNGVSSEEISSVLDSYNAYVKAEGFEGRYIKAGGNWFAERYWENEYTISKKKPKNSFHDFNQREYDWAALEKMEREYQNKIYDLTPVEFDKETGRPKRD